jgi:hypothetical protein
VLPCACARPRPALHERRRRPDQDPEWRGGAQNNLRYAHIPQRHATRFNAFCTEYLNPFSNFHCLRLFAIELPSAKHSGQLRHVYRAQDVMASPDKLTTLPEAQSPHAKALRSTRCTLATRHNTMMRTLGVETVVQPVR